MSTVAPTNASSHTRPILAPYNHNEEIIIPNPAVFQQKLNHIISGGHHNLEFISDFDFTMSRHHVGDLKGNSTYQVMETGALDGEKLQLSHDYFNFYHPIEIDPNVSHDEKTNAMNEWWEKCNDLILSEHVHKDMLYDFIMKSNMYLREGVDRVLHHCDRYLIPFTIISAGCGNIIEVALDEYLEHEKLEVHSNFLLSDSGEGFTHWSAPSLRTLNKNLILKERAVKPNLIVLGDMPSDTKMIEFAIYTDALKIGFLNSPNDYVMSSYMESFDIIILNDGNMALVELILSLLTGETFDIDAHPSLQAVKAYLPSLVSN